MGCCTSGEGAFSACVFPMKLPSLIAVAGLSLVGSVGLRGNDATTPVDLTKRNGPFAPGATITPSQQPLTKASPIQEKRIEKSTLDLPASALGERRAAIDVQEAREKNVREKVSRSPERTELVMSAFNHRDAAITTAAATTKPGTVAKFQDSLTAASTTNMARFPANGGVTTSKINRFVFRKNAPEPAPVTGGAPVTPAAGGGQVLK